MSSEDFEFDPAENVLRFKHDTGARILVSLLVAAKFGDHYDYRILLNPTFAGLIDALNAHVVPQMEEELQRFRTKRMAQPRVGFDRTLMTNIGNRIVEYGQDLGWWQMTHKERVDYIQSVIACPHTFPDEAIEVIFETIEHKIRLAKRLVEASDNLES